MPLSSDPDKRARSLANLEAGRRAGKERRPAKGASTHIRRQFTGREGVTHGGRAKPLPGALAAKTDALYAMLADAAPVRAADGGLPTEDSPVVRLLADCLCRLDSISEWLGEQGLFNDDGTARNALDLERSLRSQALEFCRELGLTPSSRAKLGLDLVRGLSAAERLEAHLATNHGDTIDAEAT